ncbi:MAG TPA: AbrB/MazE/SpoVT family DNA-binding domain-containing protein [Paenibacillaceae bacterium]|nr:AbrB/MazE/SpoVT family DNA-binding domain-containing protein [Paenibacillaceae bacterium]
MEVSRMSSKGQVTIPKSVREMLKLNEGDKVAFIEENGKFVITKASVIALREFLNEMSLEIKNKGITEEELVGELEQVREKMWNEGKK